MAEKIQDLGAIKAITYSCNIPTLRGLCKTDKGGLYRHEWHVHHPRLVKTADGKFHVRCSIKFRDGTIADGMKTGIDDLPAGSRQSCELLPVVPNPMLLDVIGELTLVETKGDGPNYKFEGAILCVSKKGDHLFIVDKKDLHKLGAAANISRYDAAHENPNNDVAQVAGRAYWGAVHNYAKFYTPAHRAAAQDLVEGGLHEFPCLKCRAFGERYIVENPPDYSSREGLAKYLHAFHNVVNRHLGKPEFPLENIGLGNIPATACVDCGHDAKPIPSPDGVRVWGRTTCEHCARLVAAAKTAGIEIHYIETGAGEGARLAESLGIRAVPLVEIVKGGKVVRSRLGEMDAKTLREWVNG
jgi:glutaredoxin